MKKIYTLLVCLVCLGNLTAQTSGGPDAFGYTWKGSDDVAGPTYNWIDIVPLPGAQMVTGLADDNIKGSFPVGFAFQYYWYNVSSFWIGSNGYMGFTNGQLSAPFVAIPTATGTQNFLSALGSDLIFDPTNTAQCWRWTNATNDTLIVSWIDVPFYDQTIVAGVGNNTFQIILSAVDSSITYQYMTQTGVTNPLNVTTGIENNSGSVGLQHLFNVFPTSGYAVKFYYPVNSTFSVSDASTTFNNNPESAGVFISRNGNQFTMNTEVKNTGNQSLTPFNVFSRVLNGANAIQVQDNQMSTALTPGQTQSITMTNKFNPTTAGTFRFFTDTQLPGDATPSNNQKIQELVVVDTTFATVRLSYDAGGVAAAAGLSWTGGNGAAANYFAPPFYPCKVTELLTYITANPNFVGYTMLVYDDSGPGGSIGVRLDSIPVLTGNIVTGAWNQIILATPLVVNTGGVYVVWKMDGSGIGLGVHQAAPFSMRGLEGISGVWAPYRNAEMEDLMINIRITNMAGTGIGMNEVVMNDHFSALYPNPTNSTASIDFSTPFDVKKLSCEIYDIQGKLIANQTITGLSNQGKLNINIEGLNAGIYTCKIIADGNAIVRKLVVTQ